MTTKNRRFYVPEGRVLVLPVSLKPGPNATNMRYQPGEAFELEQTRIAQHDRFVNGRLRAGDLVELEDGKDPPAGIQPADQPAPTTSDPKNPPAVSITPKE